MPAYNPLVYVFDSNMKSTNGFRYIVELYRAVSQPVKIAEFKIGPRPGDGYGYIDISGILKNYVDKALTFGSADYDATLNTAFGYNIHIGEEYLFNAFYSGVTNVGGFMAFNFPNGHGVSSSAIGQNIRTQNNFTPYPDSRQNINGVWLIQSVPNANQIVTSIPWGVITGNPISALCPGFMFFADRRTFRKTGLFKINSSTVLNVALGLDEYKDYIDAPSSPWAANSAAGELLTNMPLTGFTATLNQHLYVHAYARPTTGVEFVYFENSNGMVFRRAYSSTLPEVKGFAVGPGNYGTLIQVSGPTGTLIEPNTEWYEYWVRNTAGTWQSQRHRVNLDRRCAINEYQILFMDRKSSWSSYAFQLRRKEAIEVEKSMYRKEIPKTLTPSWVTLDRADQGTTIYHSRFTKRFELNTDWMNDAMSLYFEELLTSPYCYVNWGDGKWYSVIVEPGTFETMRYKNERLIRKTITCYASIEDPVQTAASITPYIGKGYNLADGYQDAVAGDIVVEVKPGPGLG